MECRSLHISQIQDNRRPPYWKSEICNISATVLLIEMKFCNNMQIAIIKRADSANLHISKIQNGGRPPCLKNKKIAISPQLQPIKTKFCRNMQFAIVNRT